LARRKSRKVARKTQPRSNSDSKDNREISASRESIKAAEDLALAAFASGLKLAAAFGTVAAKTTSLALASIATGADKFSELVKQEAIRSQRINPEKSVRVHRKRSRKRGSGRE
jgi:predicted dienelactone hydrolase